jgi:nitroreductase
MRRIVTTLPLLPDELLTTTRAVRKRLDFTRPVERATIEECIAIAQQAPTGSNAQGWAFVVVTDPEKRRAVAELYRRSWDIYLASIISSLSASGVPPMDGARRRVQERVYDSATYLAAHMHEVPVLVIPCIQGRTDSASAMGQAGTWGSILPATWSFMLAARARGLGTAWTTLHLRYEEEAAAVLGIPFAKVMQAALIPVAYTRGTEFHAAPREPVSTVLHWEAW